MRANKFLVLEGKIATRIRSQVRCIFFSIPAGYIGTFQRQKETEIARKRMKKRKEQTDRGRYPKRKRKEKREGRQEKQGPTSLFRGGCCGINSVKSRRADGVSETERDRGGRGGV